jgi:ribosomal protein L37E
MSRKCRVCRRRSYSGASQFCTGCGSPLSLRCGPRAWLKLQKLRIQLVHSSIDGWFHLERETIRGGFAEKIRVRKVQVRSSAELRLAALRHRRNEYLCQLELNAFRSRNELVLKLGERTACALNYVEARRWPPLLAASCERSILRINENAQRKIAADTGRIAWRLSGIRAELVQFAGLFVLIKATAALAFFARQFVFVLCSLAILGLAVTCIYLA